MIVQCVDYFLFLSLEFVWFLWIIANAIIEQASFSALLAVPSILIAILIPLSIFMIDKKDSGFAWDKAVILTKVINSQKLFLSLTLLLVSLIFWELSAIQILWAGLFLYGTANLTSAIASSYKWLIVTEKTNMPNQNFRTIKRLEYLKSLNDKDKENVWSLTWTEYENSRGIIEERKLVKIFIEHLEDLAMKDLPSKTFLLQNFVSYIEKITILDPQIHKMLIDFSLSWSLSLADDRRKKQSSIDFLWTAQKLYDAILRYDIKNQFGAFLLFTDSKKYIEENGVSIEKFVKNFAPMFFDELSKVEDRSHIWDAFPLDWKVTFENLNNPKTQEASLSWLNSYLKWIEKSMRINPSKSDYDIILQEVTMHLFPKVEIQTWADLLTFSYRSVWDISQGETIEGAQVKAFAESTSTFGVLSRVHSFWEVEGKTVESLFAEKVEEEFQEVMNIAKSTTVFAHIADKESFQKYLKEIKELGKKYKDDDLRKVRIKRLKNILEALNKEIK